MNDKRDMIPMVWGYIKSRETARRMDAYAGEGMWGACGEFDAN